MYETVHRVQLILEAVALETFYNYLGLAATANPGIVDFERNSCKDTTYWKINRPYSGVEVELEEFAISKVDVMWCGKSGEKTTPYPFERGKMSLCSFTSAQLKVHIPGVFRNST